MASLHGGRLHQRWHRCLKSFELRSDVLHAPFSSRPPERRPIVGVRMGIRIVFSVSWVVRVAGAKKRKSLVQWIARHLSAPSRTCKAEISIDFAPRFSSSFLCESERAILRRIQLLDPVTRDFRLGALLTHDLVPEAPPDVSGLIPIA